MSVAASERLDAVLAILETALDEVGRFGLRDAVERAWHALGGPATVAVPRDIDEAQAYLDQLSSLEQRGTRLPDLDDLEEALDDLYAPPTAAQDLRVQLMTIHKAKGLEFDTVIVPGLERPLRRDARALIRWTRLESQPGETLLLAPLHARDGTIDAMYQWLNELEWTRSQHERRRLLYVAATRARRSLHLLGSVEVKVTGGVAALQRPMRHTPLGLLWTAVAPAFDAAFASTSALPTSEPDERRGKVSVLCRLPDDWRAPALPAAPRITVAPLERVVDTLQPEFDWASATARSVGTVVHRALQRLARDAGPLDVATIHDAACALRGRARRARCAGGATGEGVGACHGRARAYVDGRARPLAVCGLPSGRRRGARAHRSGGCRNRPRCCRSNLRRRARHSLDHRLQDQRARGR